MHCIPRALLISSLASLALSTHAQAEDRAANSCINGETVAECIQAWLTLSENPPTPPTVQTASTLSTSNSGPDTGRDFSSSLTNFVKLLSVQVDGLQITNEKSAISVDWRLPLENASVLAQGLLRRPQLGSNLVLSDSAREALRKELGDFADYELALQVALTRGQSQLLSNLEAAIGELNSSDKPSQPVKVQKHNSDCTVEARKDFPGKYENTADIPVQHCPKAREALETDLGPLRDYVHGVRDLIEALPAALQTIPQLHARVAYTKRDELVGTDSFQGELTYEMPLSGFKAPSCENCGKEFSQFLRNVRARKSVLDQLRLAARVTYRRNSAYSLVRPEHNLNLSSPKTNDFSATIVLGTYLRGNGGVGSLRLDADGSYTWKDDGTTNTTRAKASATFTAKLAENLTLPVGVVWANKPDLLGDPDLKAGVHVGFNYKLPAILGN